MKRIYLSSPTMHGEELQFVNEAFEKNWIAPVGFNIDLLEKETDAYINGLSPVRYRTMAVCSGTAALHLAYKVAGITKGTPVFVSDSTYCATAFPITYEGGVPIFIDSERDSWNMDPEALEKAFQAHPEVRHVVVVHLFGTPAKMDEIMAVCERHHAMLIEDAAEALSSYYHGRHCGTFGRYNAFSFNGNKIITTSSGGMFVAPDEESWKRAFYFATQAREPVPWFEHENIGYNYRLSNVLAGIGRGQLLHLDEHHARKKHIYEAYQKGFSDLPLAMNPFLPDTEPNYWLSCILIDRDAQVTPLQILHALSDEENAESRPVWKPMSMQKVYAGAELIKTEEKPVGYDLFERGLCLPSDIKMTDEDIDRVIACVRRQFAGK